jgi:hypothetical protein
MAPPNASARNGFTNDPTGIAVSASSHRDATTSRVRASITM